MPGDLLQVTASMFVSPDRPNRDVNYEKFLSFVGLALKQWVLCQKLFGHLLGSCHCVLSRFICAIDCFVLCLVLVMVSCLVSSVPHAALTSAWFLSLCLFSCHLCHRLLCHLLGTCHCVLARVICVIGCFVICWFLSLCLVLFHLCHRLLCHLLGSCHCVLSHVICVIGCLVMCLVLVIVSCLVSSVP